MTPQLMLICSFFLTGILLQGCLKRRAPLWFFLPSAYFWGALNWALLTLLSALVLQQVSLPFLLTLNGLEIIVASIIIIRKRAFAFNRRDWGALILYTAFFIGVACLFSFINVSKVSPDSLYLLKMADQIAANGFTHLTWTSPAAFGYLVSLTQASAGALGLDYLFLFQPVLSMNFIALIFLTLLHFTSALSRMWMRVLLGLAVVTLVFTSTMMRFQFGYIHTNLPSSAFLFSALVALILLARTREEHWLLYAMAGFVGFGITRTENPLFLLLFLGMYLSVTGTTSRQRTVIVLPALAVVLLTLVVTFAMDKSHVNAQLSVQLPRAIIGGMIVVYLFIMLFLMLSHIAWIERVIIPNLYKLLSLGVAAAFVLALVINPQNILASLASIFTASLLSGGWDATWLIAAVLLALLLLYYRKEMTQKPASILGISLLLYFLGILLMSLYRAPYHAQWNDSANRMLSQLLPPFLLFVALVLDSVVADSTIKPDSEMTPSESVESGDTPHA